MSWRDIVGSAQRPVWPIRLATHLDTLIENETGDPGVKPAGLRANREEFFRGNWTTHLEPTYGYNCVGHVFASRRTSVHDVSEIDTFLREDGYAKVDSDDVRVGDVAAYSDASGPSHVAPVFAIEKIVVLSAGQSSEVAKVLSKFDDVSGEYEHSLDDLKWSHDETLTIALYRPRSRAPRAPWRRVVAGNPRPR